MDKFNSARHVSDNNLATEELVPPSQDHWSATYWVELFRKVVAHGDTREGKWRENWRMEWVASTLTPPPNVVYPALLKLMRKSRLPAVDWTDAPTDLNGLVRFGERRYLVSGRVPSCSARAIQHSISCITNSNAPENGQNCCPKHVELNWIYR